jgi:hypothetical protein
MDGTAPWMCPIVGNVNSGLVCFCYQIFRTYQNRHLVEPAKEFGRSLKRNTYNYHLEYFENNKTPLYSICKHDSRCHNRSWKENKARISTFRALYLDVTMTEPRLLLSCLHR